MREYRCLRMVIDAVAYQRVLMWIMQKAMERNRIWHQIVPIADGMAKFARITGVLNPLATRGKLIVGAQHTIFANQFAEYGPLYGGIDDDLDASALALQDLSNPFAEQVASGLLLPDSHVEDNPFIASCP